MIIKKRMTAPKPQVMASKKDNEKTLTALLAI
jgi:hypothetical protein